MHPQIHPPSPAINTRESWANQKGSRPSYPHPAHGRTRRCQDMHATLNTAQTIGLLKTWALAHFQGKCTPFSRAAPDQARGNQQVSTLILWPHTWLEIYLGHHLTICSMTCDMLRSVKWYLDEFLRLFRKCCWREVAKLESVKCVLLLNHL